MKVVVVLGKVTFFFSLFESIENKHMSVRSILKLILASIHDYAGQTVKIKVRFLSKMNNCIFIFYIMGNCNNGKENPADELQRNL